MTKGSDTTLPAWNGILRILLYVFAVLAGLAVVTFLRPDPNRGFLYALGLGAGLVGFAVLAMQAVLAARFHWIERPFGLDQMFRFHRAMALFAVVLLLVHPVLLAWGSGNWRLLWGLALPWNIWVGKLALLALVVHWLVSQFRERMRFEFRDKFIGDGVVAATPFGSTAYYHSITRTTFDQGIGIAFNNCTGTTEPLRLGDNARLDVRIVRSDAHLSVDNHPELFALSEGDTVSVRRAEQETRLVGHQ